ncbi:hypothetical protein RCL_jg19908.t1 [Rhizophagus clarus]|uniref:Secreted protein n=1 Tax=Rhizophagus clarus TaxID=94130 RepID=A0A8H3L877_9GLOM|nr:hypothetical protein RCL_jg19908.t1 [Rhizophagus clarus]
MIRTFKILFSWSFFMNTSSSKVSQSQIFTSLKYYFAKISSTCLPDGIPLYFVANKISSSGRISSSSSANGENSIGLIY